LKSRSPVLHPSFKLNGLDFESAEELLNFADGLILQGAKHEVQMARFIERWLSFDETIMVKSSGSTGKPKKIFLQKEHMINSAKATGSFFKLGAGTSALLCLPPNFIAGKMMLVRAMTLGWDLHVVAPEKDALTQYDNDYDFAAMVPYQVYHSLEALPKVKKLIIGGVQITRDLESKLQAVSTEVFETYGMTETCTHVAIRRINGPAMSDSFSALPNVKFSVDDRGCLVISAPEILEEALVTNDIVNLHTPSSFSWLGRFDNVINSGGVKIFPEKIEEKLSEYIDLPFIIASEKHQEFGEQVIMIIENKDNIQIPNYTAAFSTLDPYERPKKIYTISMFPYSKAGKLKRAGILEFMKKYLES